VIVLLGNLSRDVFPGQPPRVGGAPFHAARALQRLQVEARIYARCAAADRAELLPPLVALGTPVLYMPGTATASFTIRYDGELRQMEIGALGDTWLPVDVPVLPETARWLHVAPLTRCEFPAATLAALARGGGSPSTARASSGPGGRASSGWTRITTRTCCATCGC
jgi:hypothetical protein